MNLSEQGRDELRNIGVDASVTSIGGDPRYVRVQIQREAKSAFIMVENDIAWPITAGDSIEIANPDRDEFALGPEPYQVFHVKRRVAHNGVCSIFECV